MPKLPKRLVRVLDDTELQKVWQSKYLVGSSPLAIRNRAMLALMLDTGLRREEVATITLDNLSMERRTVTVIGKGNKERRVFFSLRVRELLKEFLAIRGVDDEPLFHLNAGGIRTQFRRIKEELGMDHFHPHLLRHQFATQMLRETKNMEYVRLLLGHEDYNTTKRYLQLTDEDLQEAHESGSPFDNLVGQEEPTPIKRRQRYSAKAS
jgi:site-specific recombinase XerD